MSVLQNVEKLNKAILEGRTLEAFEEMYADNVVMQENNNPPVVGKDANRQREKEFFGNITAFHGAEVKNVATGENLSMVEWTMEYEHKEWGHVKSHQVTVQEWENDKIVREHFFYGS